MSEKGRHTVILDKSTALLSRNLALDVGVSQSKFIEESIRWLANYLRKSPASITEIMSLTGLSELEKSTLTVRFAQQGESELELLMNFLKCSANGAIRAAIRVCANFVESQEVDLLQEQILQRNLSRYLSDLRRAGFRVIDVSYPLIDDTRAKNSFFLLCRERFVLAKSSAVLKIVASPVGNEVALWRTDQDGTRRVDLMLVDVVGDLTEYSRLSDEKMFARLTQKWQAISNPRGWRINPQFGPRERRLAKEGVRFVPLPPDTNTRSYFSGEMREVALQLGNSTLKAIQQAGTNLGNTIRNQPTFALISDPIENPRASDQPRKPAALLICFDPNRRIQLEKMTKDSEHAFVEGGALVRDIVAVVDRYIGQRK